MEKPIPEGYWKDARGSLVPVDLIKPIDKQRDQLVREIVENAKQLNELMTKFKANTFGDIEAFVDLSLQEYNTKLGGKKGNVSLATFDGQFKVVRVNADNINFDERIQAAKELIDECVAEWSVGARPEIKAIIDNAFAVDKQGKISPEPSPPGERHSPPRDDARSLETSIFPRRCPQEPRPSRPHPRKHAASHTASR